MTAPRFRSSLLWGLTGGLSFLVLLQGYELVTTVRVDWLVKFGVAALVTAGGTGLTHVLARRRAAANERA
ncbi:hypothetical protein [Halorientalis halophila]|uniref:hypothetical protein n=1 Tax=Halorientalis halophila TaxID=3108499 RepID=UPI0030083063